LDTYSKVDGKLVVTKELQEVVSYKQLIYMKSMYENALDKINFQLSEAVRLGINE